MTSFIQDVIAHLNENKEDFSRLTFVVPSKRAGVFLLHELSQNSSKSQFAPEIFSIEEFIEELAQLSPISNTEVVFYFYDVYKKIHADSDHDSFDDFLGWARILLHDFNEIDRYLIDPDSIFDYLEAIKDINHWSMQSDKSGIITNYMKFWKSFKPLYKALNQKLMESGFAYQGLLYREAVNNLETYIHQHPNKQHIIMGFNALNTAESTIFQELLQNELANIYWDIDSMFMDKSSHSAGFFIRSYVKQWRYYKRDEFLWKHNHYSTKKSIQLIGTSRNIGQAKYVGEIISTILKQNKDLKNTAVILGDESLLIPTLTAMPTQLQALNVTMGLPLKQIPLSGFFESWFFLQSKTSSQFYYRDVLEILTDSTIRSLYVQSNGFVIDELIKTIKNQNLTFVNYEDLLKLTPGAEDLTALIFEPWSNDPMLAVNKILDLIYSLKSFYDKDKESNKLPLEFLYRFYQLFNSIKTIMGQYPFVDSIKALQSLYRDQLNRETLDFKGEPLQGLQIMGMLESRILDFDTVIITSVNEGILPAGQSSQSFIPYDLKREHGLPTTSDKDAVYTYHFYRLIQRAKHVYLLYNTEPDVLNGGEMSRFINQIQLDGIHDIQHSIVQAHVPTRSEHKYISKNPEIIAKIKSVFEKGISPSALLQYIRNPMDFYARYIIGIDEAEQVEEVVAANTLGTVIHETLRELYEPFVGKMLSIEDLESAKSKSLESILKHFKKFYKAGDLKRGKNLIIFEIAKQYVSNLIDLDMKSLRSGNQIKIIGVEATIKSTANFDGIPFTVCLKGQIDRIDEFNGFQRVIDYKTGKVDLNEVEIVAWDELTTDYKAFGKSFQVLMYSYILNLQSSIQLPVEAGIISFRNLNSGFLKFSKKNRKGQGAIKESLVSEETLKSFENQLLNLLIEILNPEIDFKEKDI